MSLMLTDSPPIRILLITAWAFDESHRRADIKVRDRKKKAVTVTRLGFYQQESYDRRVSHVTLAF